MLLPSRRLRPWLQAGHLRPLTAFLVSLLGCTGGTDLLLPGDGTPAAIQWSEGQDQSARVGEPLDDPLVFTVVDSRGRPVEGAQVAFSVAQAGPGATTVPESATSDANGRVETQFQLGTTIGPQTGEASVVVQDGAQQPAITFTAMALSENANEIAAASGDGQSGPAGSVLAQPLVVRVTDAFGNPISGVPISWSVDGGGSVSESSNATDQQGLASVTRTLGPVAGPQSTIASSEGLAGSPVTFTHTATAGTASLLSIVSGDGQTALAGTELPGDLVVQLLDAQGNPVAGAPVTWVVGTGGGQVAPENTVTDEAGGTSTRWTLGPQPGANRVDAVVSGVGVVHFQATGSSVRPAALAILTQPSTTTRNGARLDRQPVVQVKDQAGNNANVPGIEVTAQLAGGGGVLLGTRQLRTDASGRVAYADLAIAGAEGSRTLVFTAAGYSGVTSTPIQIQPIPTTTTITGDTPDPSPAGTVVTVSFTVSAEGVVPIGKVTVTDGVDSCQGTLLAGAGSCQLPITTAGPRTLQATYAGSPGLQSSSDIEDHQVSAPPPGNQPPRAEFHSSCNQLTCRFTDASTDSDGNVVSWSWNFGDNQTSTERQPTHTFPAPGTYRVTLTIADNDGAGAQAEAQVQVAAPPPPPNKKPHAEFEVSCTDLTCTFTDRSTDEDGTIIGRVWDYGDGSSGATASHTYGGGGTYHVTLTVTDDDGATDSHSHDAHPTAPPPPNQSPTAAFTADCKELKCSFDSNDSHDPDGRIISRNWTFGDNTSSAEDHPSHEYAGAGTYDVTLTVTDDDAATNSVTHSVTVNGPPPPPNKPPHAEFDVSCTDLSCTFIDHSTDDDGNIVSRSWDYGDGASGATPSHTYTSGGTYQVTLTVTDNDGAPDSRTHDAHPTAPPPQNQSPTAAFVAPSCTATQACQFNDGSSDNDGNVTGWDWNFGDGSPHSGAQNPSHTYGSGGNYTVTLTVTDNDGAESAPTQHQVNVGAAPNQAPSAAFNAPSCTATEACQFTDGSSDDDGTVTGWDWDFGDGSAHATDRNPSHTYATEGSPTVTLTVTDNDGASDQVSQQVTVSAASTASAAGSPRTSAGSSPP